MRNIFIITGLAVLSWIVIGQYFQANQDLNSSKLQYVQAICDQAHNEYSGASENACGQAQDETNTEYLCNSTGTSCWTEAK